MFACRIISFFFICLPIYSNSQIISFGQGLIYYKSKTISPIINEIEEVDSSPFHRFSIQHTIFKKWKLNHTISGYRGFSRFKVDTDFWRGNGSSSSMLFKYGLLLMFDIAKSERLHISPLIGFEFEYTASNANPGEIRALIDEDSDPNYYGLISLETIPRNQILPVVGLDFSYRFWWRFYINFNTYAAYGYKPYQKYYFDYTYNGVLQPTGEWHTNGSGFFITIGVGYHLWGYDEIR